MDGKCYIGQSKRESVKARYGGFWWKWTANRYLKFAIKKYGVNNFSVNILRENIISLEELNKLEKEYIKNYNCVAPNGYNFLEGGREKDHHKETRLKLAMAHGPKGGYTFKDPNGKIHENIINLTQFAKERKLNRIMMLGVFYGKYKQHKKWTRPETELIERKYKSPTGEIHIVGERELRPFCRKFGLHHWAMIKVWKGKAFHHKGWTKLKQKYE